jgi:glycosyltransferase involved in cell wall biosynthesis
MTASDISGRHLIPRLRKDFTDFELIVSDSASTDSTEEICQTYAARDKRVRYLRSETNRGVTWNFRYVLEVAVQKGCPRR